MCRSTIASTTPGLTVRAQTTNIGDSACPYGCGQHPYLSLGTEVIDPCQLQLAADSCLPTDDRGLPKYWQPVAGTEYDFRTARAIGTANIDNTFTDLTRDENARLGAFRRPERPPRLRLGR